jgi:hypothetical protein
MLTALPIVLACHALQPCQAPSIADHELVRSVSPAAIVTHAPGELLTGDARQSLRSALRRVTIPSARTRRAQAARPQSGRTTYSKTMLVVLGVMAGCYAGAYLGEAMEENGWFPGMTIGAAAGGLMAWMLVR